MLKNILHLEEPALNSCSPYGCFFLIMSKNMLPWIYNNFIQIKYSKEMGLFQYSKHHQLLTDCSAITYYSFSKNTIIQKWNQSIKEVVIDAIDSNNYLYMNVDYFYLPDSFYFMFQHNIAEIFVYGYDLKKGCANIIANINGIYKTIECLFIDLENAYWKQDDKNIMTKIHFIQVNKNCEYKINLNQIIIGLEDYLYSKGETYSFNQKNYDIGIESYNHIFEELSRVAISRNIIDIRTFDFMYEHQLLMEMRVKYFIDHKYFDDAEELLEDFKELTNEYLKLRNMVLLYELKKNDYLMNVIINTIDNNIIIEKKLISDLIKKLNTSKTKYTKYKKVSNFLL